LIISYSHQILQKGGERGGRGREEAEKGERGNVSKPTYFTPVSHTILLIRF